MSSTIFTGVATALITPMHEDGSINLSKIDEIIEQQIEGGVAAIVSWRNNRRRQHPQPRGAYRRHASHH